MIERDLNFKLVGAWRKPDSLHFVKLCPSRPSLIWGARQVNVSLGAVGRLSLQLMEAESIQTAEFGELLRCQMKLPALASI